MVTHLIELTKPRLIDFRFSRSSAQFDLAKMYITWKRQRPGKAEAAKPCHERRSECARVLNRVFTLVDRQIALG